MRWVAIFVRNSGTYQLDMIKATKNSIGCSEMQPGLAFPCTASSASPRSNVGPAGCSETPPPVHTRRPDPPFQSLVNRREPTSPNLTLLFSIFFAHRWENFSHWGVGSSQWETRRLSSLTAPLQLVSNSFDTALCPSHSISLRYIRVGKTDALNLIIACAL